MAQAKAAWVDFKAVKSRVSIAQVLEHYRLVPSLARSGNGDRLSGACPIHGGNNRTHFRVSVSKNCWNCFGQCQSGGNVIDFVARKEGVEFRDAALLLQQWFLDKPSAPPMARAASEANRVKAAVREEESSPLAQGEEEEESEGAAEATENKALKFALNKLDAAHPYFRERGLTAETVAAFGLGYCSKGLMRGYACIPVHNAEGSLIAYAGRWPGTPVEGKGKYKLPKGFRKSLELFNQHRAAASSALLPLVVVEGYFDTIKLHQAGYERVVALMGSSLSPEQEAGLYRLCEKDERIVLFLDNDESGRKGQADALTRLAKRLCVRAVDLGSREAQPEHLSPEELRAILPFPERSPL